MFPRASYLVLVKDHIGNAILHRKFPPSIGTDQVPLDQVHVEQRPVKARYRRIVQGWQVLGRPGHFLRQVGQGGVAMRTQLTHGGSQRGIIDLGEEAEEELSIDGRFLAPDGSYLNE